MNVDRRQFIICNEEFQREDFYCLELEGGLYLSYHRDLKIQRLGDSILLGHAYSVHADYPVEADERYQ